LFPTSIGDATIDSWHFPRRDFGLLQRFPVAYF
jgi:hypothetical protein